MFVSGSQYPDIILNMDKKKKANNLILVADKLFNIGKKTINCFNFSSNLFKSWIPQLHWRQLYLIHTQLSINRPFNFLFSVVVHNKYKSYWIPETMRACERKCLTSTFTSIFFFLIPVWFLPILLLTFCRRDWNQTIFKYLFAHIYAYLCHIRYFYWRLLILHVALFRK